MNKDGQRGNHNHYTPQKEYINLYCHRLQNIIKYKIKNNMIQKDKTVTLKDNHLDQSFHNVLANVEIFSFQSKP